MSKIVTPVVMSGDEYSEKWSVQPWHIRIALRTYAGVQLENDACVRLPIDKTIEGPHSRYIIKLIKLNPFHSLYPPPAYMNP